jgi:hypothetical protein
MEGSNRCKICNKTAQSILDNWGSAPCLMSLDESNPLCFEYLIREAKRTQTRVPVEKYY